MDIFLMQHGEAVAAEVDPDRPLTDQGQASVGAVAQHAAACGVRIHRIFHSGKLRAEQSAAILAASLGSVAAERRRGLAPNDAVEPTAAWLGGLGESGAVAIVGHLPFLDRLASLLVSGDPGVHAVAFRNGGLVKLVPSLGGGYSVAWVITPDVAAR
ncbi:MAG: phosphohistidine phosphatase SixA [Candidatus Nanopelagicales bacterium]